jgi:hypothetical protein
MSDRRVMNGGGTVSLLAAGRICSRREVLRIAAAAGLGFSLPDMLHGEDSARRTSRPQQDMRTPIPSTKERLPVVGLGTNRFGGRAPDPGSPLCAVLAALAAEGGSVIDTARGYGRAEEVIGACLQSRERYFIATKLGLREERAPQPSGADARDELDRGFSRLQTDVIDLMMVHDFGSPASSRHLRDPRDHAGRARHRQLRGRPRQTS